MKNRPHRIGADTDYGFAAARWMHTVAIKMDGTVWTCGNNWNGQLGDGTAWRETPAEMAFQ